ncbi:xanthine dehydrogenase family protein molybdopterin-binding subunit [Marinibaculum pumilum]|uniref:Xanthine dehydrogenase family protein molybdopterin-binding subunit n=1 Tax=Marinibaculum pumilum TaxID=1766165 RepID=A0ABV7L921_9PROT
MTKFGVAQSVARVEDQRLITGTGQYTDDVHLDGQAHGVLLRSPVAHARIASVDTAAALEVPGVLAVYTIDDLKADGIGELPCMIPLKNRDGSDRAETPHPALADGVVRYVGDPVAFVVAESLAAARDGAEAIMVDYDDLPAVADLEAAAGAGAAQVWPDAAGNRAFDWEQGDKAAVDKLFADAAHTGRIRVVNNRVVVASLEPRAAIAAYDAAEERFTLWLPTQGTMLLKNLLANAVFKIPAEKIRIRTLDVGGGFGMKIFLYNEQVLCAYAARKLGRPVRWVSDRTEAFLSDTQGRDNISTAEIALDADHNFLALRVHTLAGMGAYLSTFAPMIPTMAGTKVLPSVYRYQAMHVQVEGVLTNTVPVDAYRGAGRPEANYLMERLIDATADQIGVDRFELRRRNMIPPEALPWKTPTGLTYDSGDFARNMDVALETADWAGFPGRAAAAKAAGKVRGFGLAYYLEATGGAPTERAVIRFTADETVEVLVGTQSTGQGHETAYTQLVVDRLGVPPEKVRVLQGDSDTINFGGGTGGARSLYSEGGAILSASDMVVTQGKEVAAVMLEAAAVDIEFEAGSFRIAGTDRSVNIMDLARALHAGQIPDAVDRALDADAEHKIEAITFPNGCHVAEVEVDLTTGITEVVRYTVVDDMGKVINPMIVKGQIHGGVAQGVGQALYEHTAYDEGGQLLSGSFMDYCLPRADTLPEIEVVLREVPCKTNPLGVKGAGEAGSVGAPPAVMNALTHALKDRGAAHIDMPATPDRIWQALAGKAA